MNANTFLVQNSFIAGAELLVDFFFVLSGFVIALNYFDTLKTKQNVIAFQLKRFWRLFPLHVLVLFAFVGLEFVEFAFEMWRGSAGDEGAFVTNNAFAFFMHFFMLHSLFLDRLAFNYTSWSISSEFYTYAFFALLMMLKPIRHIGVLFTVLFSAFYLIHVEGGYLRLLWGGAIFRCFFSFFLGVIAYRAVANTPYKFGSLIPSAFFVLSVVMVCFLHKSPKEFLLPIAFSFLIASAYRCREEAYFSRLLSLKAVVYLGTISYSIYMLHLFVWTIQSIIFKQFFNISAIPGSNGRLFLEVDPVTGTVLTLADISILLVLSHFSYKYVECRFRKGLKKIA